MSVKVGELYGELKLDKKGFDSTLDDAEKQSKGWASRIGGSIAGAAKSFLKFGAVGALAIGGISFKLGDMASDMNEARSKVGVVFGEMAEDVEWFAARGPKALGMSETAVLSAMGTYGNLFSAMKIGAKETQGMSEGLLTLAADLASFNNMDPTEVLEKLRAGLVGEAEPLRTLGVNLNQAKIEARALELGLWNGIGTIDSAAKAQASYSLILEETALAQGDFARTSDGMANQQRILAATFETTMASLGAAFIPIIQAILPQLTAGLQGFATWVSDNGPAIQAIAEQVMAKIGEAIGFVTTVILPALGAAFSWIVDNILPIFQKGADAVSGEVMPALGAAFKVITEKILPALGAVFKWIVDNILPPLRSIFDTFSTTVLPLLAKAFQFVVDWISNNWPTISKIVMQVANVIKVAFDIIAQIIKIVYPIIAKVAEFLFPLLGAAATAVMGTISFAFDAIGAVFQIAANIAKTVVNAIFGSWRGMTSFFDNLWQGIGRAIKGGINVVIGLVNGMIGFLNGIQIHIPAIGVGPVQTPRMDWNGLNLGKLPYLASGTPNFKGGWAMLGERGPELAKLPGGTQVFSNSRSHNMMSGGGSKTFTINVNGDVYGDGIDALADKLAFRLRLQGA